MNTQASKPAVPVVFWVVSVVSLLWNSYGGYDYIMSRTKNAEYLSQMGDPAQVIAWMDKFPMITQILWPVGVWGSVAASLLLLMRSRHAVTAFMVSLVGAIGSFAGQMMNPLPASLDTGGVGKIMPFVILGAIILQWWYSRRAAASGLLR